MRFILYNIVYAMEQTSIGAAILAGGKARRMHGINKALLCYQGDSFLSRIEKELDGFDEYLLAASDETLTNGTRFRLVPDIYSGKGPMGGLHAVLTRAKSAALLVLPCDMPLYERRLGTFLLSFLGKGYDAWICRTRDGLLHPLCGVYTKACLPAVENCLAGDRLSLLDIYPQVRTLYVEPAVADIPDAMFLNVNTRLDYERLERHDGI